MKVWEGFTKKDSIKNECDKCDMELGDAIDVAKFISDLMARYGKDAVLEWMNTSAYNIVRDAWYERDSAQIELALVKAELEALKAVQKPKLTKERLEEMLKETLDAEAVEIVMAEPYGKYKITERYLIPGTKSKSIDNALVVIIND